MSTCPQNSILQQPIKLPVPCNSNYSECSYEANSTNPCCQIKSLYVAETSCINGSKQYICNRNQPTMSEQETLNCCFGDPLIVNEHCGTGWCNGSEVCEKYKMMYCIQNPSHEPCVEYCKQHKCDILGKKGLVSDIVTNVMGSNVAESVMRSFPYKIVIAGLIISLIIKLVKLFYTVRNKKSG